MDIRWSDGASAVVEPGVFEELASASVRVQGSFSAMHEALDILAELIGNLSGRPDECRPDTSQPYPF